MIDEWRNCIENKIAELITVDEDDIGYLYGSEICFNESETVLIDEEMDSPPRIITGKVDMPCPNPSGDMRQCRPSQCICRLNISIRYTAKFINETRSVFHTRVFNFSVKEVSQ